MKFMSFLCCLLALTALPAHAGAGTDAMRAKQVACRQLSDYRQIAGCYKTALEESDALLNKEYNALAGYLSGVNKANLIDAQRKWIKFRDADCAFSEPRPNDEAPASANRFACLADRTIERLNHFEDYNVPWNKGCNGCPW